MNKHYTQCLKLLLLFVLVLSSGCGPVTAIPSPTLTTAPYQTTAPNPTTSPEPISLDGILIYSDTENTFAVDLQTQEINSVFTTYGRQTAIVANNQLYISNHTRPAGKPYRSEIIRMDFDGTNKNIIVSSNEKVTEYSFLSVSPNNQYLAYSVYGDESIIIIDTKTNLFQVIPEESSRRFISLSWSPDSKKIFLLDASYARVINEYGRLLEYSLETETLMELLSDFPDPGFKWDSEIAAVEWSPDGINAILNLSDNIEDSSIYLFNTVNQKIDRFETPGRVSHFVWSHDGRKVLLKILVNNQPKLFILGVDEKNLHEIEVEGTVYSFSWSPRGNEFIYSLWDGEQPGIYLFDIRTGKSENILESAKHVSVFQYIWSPDGTKVVFEQGQRTTKTTYQNSLWILNLINRTIADIDVQEHATRSGQITNPADWLFSPTWSPDSKFIAYFINPDNKSNWVKQKLVLRIISIENSVRREFAVSAINEPWIFHPSYWIYPSQ